MLQYTNPVHATYFADPFVWRTGEEYYAIGTGPGEAVGQVPHATGASIFPLLRSSDLISWVPAGFALVPPAAALGDTFWAPEIAEAEGRWYLYYSVGHGDKRHQLRVASSEHPLGPYVDCAQLTDPDQVPFAIDPHPFKDEDGRWYLFHARDFLDSEVESIGHIRAGTALVVAELESMTHLSSKLTTVQRARCDWQRYAAQRPMYNGVFDWHTLEGPTVVKEGGRYYCLYSGGCWQNNSYGVDYTVADHVLGPYEDVREQAVPRIMRTIPAKVIGPGHCSVVTAFDETTRFVVYHAWDEAMTARRMCIDELYFDAHGPRSTAPSWTARELSPSQVRAGARPPKFKEEPRSAPI